MLGKWREWRTGKQGKELEEEEKKVEEEKIGDSNVEILEYVQSPWLPRKFPPLPAPTTDEKEEKEERAASGFGRKERKWPVPWHWQFMVLTVRTFRQSRHILLSKTTSSRLCVCPCWSVLSGSKCHEWRRASLIVMAL